MDKQTFRLISVISTTILCGLPGLAGLCFGPLAIIGALLPDSTLAPEDTNLAIGVGIGILILSLILIAIPVWAGFQALKDRRRTRSDHSEPVPPNDF